MKNFPNGRPNSYPRTVELDCVKLSEALQKKQKDLGISQREVTRRLGEITANSLTRLKCGVVPSSNLLIRMLVWLGTTDVGPYIKEIE